MTTYPEVSAAEYRIQADEKLEAAVRRIAHEQVEQAIAQLRGIDTHNAQGSIHQCRKHIKKLRGLLRMVRPSMGRAYRPANNTFRDAARLLSPYRDAHALLATFDDAIAADPEGVPAGGLGVAWRELVRRADDSTRSVTGGSAEVQRALELLEHGAEGIDGWKLKGSGWNAASGGVIKTYRRGLVALSAIEEGGAPERFHELRKRAKYTWYHLRLLDETAPSVLAPTAGLFHALTDGLGDAHDLAVLRDMMLDEPDAFGGDEMVAAAFALLDGYRLTLERRSTALAELLYAESSEAFAERLGVYWSLRKRPPHGAAGELAKLFPPDDAWEKCTVARLRIAARSVGLPGRSTMHRDRLVAALRAEGVDPGVSSD